MEPSNEGRSWLYVQNLNKNHIDRKVKVPYVYARKVSLHGRSGVIVNWKCETTVLDRTPPGIPWALLAAAPVAVVTA
ncbi:MAG: hypothetical protein ACLVC5_09440 [Clostridia bacterium]